jgi:2,3-diaminopropionate biosynthesis protein SbnA
MTYTREPNTDDLTGRLAEGIVGAIGSTPLVRMRRLLRDDRIELWGKLESSNPGGSSKDRPAALMIEEALRDGRIGSETTVIESSSGNMAIGLAQVCRYHGLDLICVVDSRTTSTNIRVLRALGADVRVVTEPDLASGDLLTARLDLVARLAEQIPNAFWPDQYSNRANPDAHDDGTAREIFEALEGHLDALVVAAGTAGTLRGCAQYIRRNDLPTRLIAVDSTGSALFGGSPGPRRLPGHGAGTESRHSREVLPDEIVRVSDLDCVVGCRRLVAREAIFAGASSGAVAIAVERIAPSLEPGSRCAIILPDGGIGYLGTVYDDEWVAAELGCSSDRLADAVDDRSPPPA